MAFSDLDAAVKPRKQEELLHGSTPSTAVPGSPWTGDGAAACSSSFSSSPGALPLRRSASAPSGKLLPAKKQLFREEEPSGAEGAPPVRTVGEWCKVWKSLRLSSGTLEGDCRRELFSARGAVQALAAEILTEVGRLESERAGLEKAAWADVAQMRRRVLALGQALPHASRLEDVEALVTGAERELVLLAERRRQESEELALEELSLHEALQGVQTRFEGWLSQPSAASRRSTLRAPVCRRRTPRRRTPRTCRQSAGDQGVERLRTRAQVLAAEDERDGGQTGGWPQDDHDAFMTALRKRPRQEPDAAFLETVATLLPHRQHQELVNHVSWLLRHEQRHDEKRGLVEDWRTKRDTDRQAARSTPPSDAVRARSDAEEAQAEKKAKAKAAQRRAAELVAQKQRVLEWRAQKEAEKAAAAAQAREQEEAQRQRQLDEQRRLLAEKQDALEAFRARKAAEGSAQQAAGSASAPLLSAEDRQRLASRSASLVDRRTAARQKVVAQAEAEASKGVFCPPPRKAYEHVASKVLEDAESRAQERASNACAQKQEAAEASRCSKYSKVHGDWAHQGLIRTTRALPSWRPRYGT